MRSNPYLLNEVPEFISPKVGLAVLGHPISHSISPLLHKAALQKLSIENLSFNNWFYERVDVKAEFLSIALSKLSESGYLGLNLTIPHKVKAFDIIENIDEGAVAMGAVNTLFYKSHKWVGYNTDGYGISKAVSCHLGYQIKDSSVLILGAGGAARAASVQFLREGCRELKILNRSKERMQSLLHLLNDSFGSVKVSGDTFDTVDAKHILDRDWLVVNATASGLKKNDISPFPFDLSLLGKGSAVYDMIYNPSKTKLLEEAECADLPFANGLHMLVYQAAKALEIWTGREVCSDTMLQAALGNLSDEL
ncbi:MAG TPA: shikimate dehydrogenase [Opitutae bacterium]|nr:shikimate dehydrogenase [Opitutae bacterium]